MWTHNNRQTDWIRVHVMSSNTEFSLNTKRTDFKKELSELVTQTSYPLVLSTLAQTKENLP